MYLTYLGLNLWVKSYCIPCISQHLESGSKIDNYKMLGHPVFQSRQATQITTINIYLLNEIKHNVHIQCHGNYIEVKMIHLCALN